MKSFFRSISILLFTIFSLNQSSAQLTPSFTISDSAICLGDTVFCVAAATGQVSYLWVTQSNGNGSAPTFSFSPTYPGAHWVILQVTNAQGQTVNQTKSVQVEDIYANFTYWNDFPCEPAEIRYEDMTQGQGTSVYGWTTWWDLGDGTLFDSTFVLDSFGQFYHTIEEAGTYQTSMIVSTNGAGCRDTFVHPTPIVIDSIAISLSAVVSPANCDSLNSGAIDVTPSVGLGAYLYSWSNGATSQNISGLVNGPYSLTLYPLWGGCPLDTTFVVDAPFVANIQADTFACDSLKGDLSVTVQGGTPPYSYLWNTGDTTATLTQQPPGGYSVTINDATNCGAHKAIIMGIADSCFVEISGQAFVDKDEDCEKAPGENGIFTHFTLTNKITQEQQVIAADNEGIGSFKVLPGEYSLSAADQLPSFASFCPIDMEYDLGFVDEDTLYIPFAFKIPDTLDYAIYGNFVGRARPGFPTAISVHVINRGEADTSITVQLIRSPDLNSPNLAFLDGNGDQLSQDTLFFTTPKLAPGKWWQFTVPLVVNITATLSTYARVMAKLDLPGQMDTLDINPKDNEDVISQLITGSYDPNDKLVEPAGEGDQGYILQEEQLMDYTIRFQNTGTDTAFFISIRDTIDTDLSMETLQLGLSSHPYALTVNGRALEFFFDNILLPDSNVNEPLSHGFVKFSLQHKDTLSIGTTITNTAAIYFDFNAPIITNTVVNTVVENVSIEAERLYQALIYPNPANRKVTVEIPESHLDSYKVINMTGKVIREQSNLRQGQIELDTGAWPRGMYLIELDAKEKRYFGKFWLQ